MEIGAERTDVSEAMAACEANPECAGITVEPGVGGRLQPTLRRGQPLLEVSPVGELSYAKWCPATPSHLPGECPFGRAVGLLAMTLRRLDSGLLGDYAPELVIEAQEAVKAWKRQVGATDAGHIAWHTEWPIWQLLGRLQQRLDFLRGSANGGGTAPPPPWAMSLQRLLGFDDESWHLVTSEINTLEGSLPAVLREKVRCANGRQCLGEMYARLHVILHDAGRLPLRDQIFMGPEDALSRIFLERSNHLAADNDDWTRMLDEELDRRENDPDRLQSSEIDRLVPVAHPLQVDRRQLAKFVLDVRKLIGEEPMQRCMEWDQPFLLLRGFEGLCRWTDIFSYSEPDPNEPMMGLPGRKEYHFGTRHYWGDLSHPDNLGIEADTFDLVLAPFVFEHIANPFVAMRNLARVLRPGGRVVWAAPMFQQFHGAPHDYYRFTPKGARALAEDAGLDVELLYAPGDLGLVTGVMTGLLAPYWTEEKMLAETAPEPGEDSPRHPTNVFMLVRKPEGWQAPP